MTKIKLILIGITTLIVSVILISCATTMKPTMSHHNSYNKGIWHRVKEGQTLWRIAKTYDMALEELKDINDIEDVVHIREGTWIFIPNAKRGLYVQGNDNESEFGKGKMDFVWPVKGEVIRPFGRDGKDFNYGIDIKSRYNESLIATAGGVIAFSGEIRGYGDTIIIEHHHDFCSLYCRDINSIVKEGQVVEKNKIIAKFKQKGKSSSDIVHYELFYKGKPVNPLYYLP